MDLIYLCVVFLVIIVVIWLKKPLYMALGGGILTTVLIYRVSLKEALEVFAVQSIASDTISVLLSFYCVTFLQKMLEQRNRLKEAQHSFDMLLRNRRVNAALSSAILGLLPSAAVMTICADMVDKTCGTYLDRKQKTFVSSYYRHIPEMFLPTYSSILLALALTKCSAGLFVVSMLPMVAVACLLGYLFYLRKMPSSMDPVETGEFRTGEVLKLAKNLWSLISVVLIIVIFNIPVHFAAIIVIAINFFLDHFQPGEIPHLLKVSAEPGLLCNMYLIMLFKGIISHVGVIDLLPDFFGQFPIPLTLVFSLIIFFGTIISGSQAMIALCLPMAFAAIPDGGLGLLVMLMCITWASMQISPTHVCSFVAAEFYHTTLGDLVVRAIPIVLLFCVIAYGYGTLLTVFRIV